jgi:hypothetical protein
MTTDSRRALGYGLLAGALGITFLMVAWLLSGGAQAGGIVLGLLLLFVLAGPLAGAGWYVVARGRSQSVEEQAFAEKRRILEFDRLFRRELSARLAELTRVSPTDRAGELETLQATLTRAAPDESAWYGAIGPDPALVSDLKPYEDTVWEQVRWLKEHRDASDATIGEALDQVARALDRRSDLLVRAKQAAAVAPTTLLGSSTAGVSSKMLTQIGLGDAVSREGTDYLVDRLATSFSDGQTWKLAHLAPSGRDGSDAWLSISPGGLELAWLHSIAAATPGAPAVIVDETSLQLIAVASALVTVQSAAGSAPGALVRAWRYRTDDRIAQVEQWPDGAVVAYAGLPVSAGELEIWPAETHIQEVAHP